MTDIQVKIIEKLIEIAAQIVGVSTLFIGTIALIRNHAVLRRLQRMDDDAKRLRREAGHDD